MSQTDGSATRRHCKVQLIAITKKSIKKLWCCWNGNLFSIYHRVSKLVFEWKQNVPKPTTVINHVVFLAHNSRTNVFSIYSSRLHTFFLFYFLTHWEKNVHYITFYCLAFNVGNPVFYFVKLKVSLCRIIFHLLVKLVSCLELRYSLN